MKINDALNVNLLIYESLQSIVNNFTNKRQNFTKVSTNLLICTLFVNKYTYRY
jgi:hypothetical protein